MINIANRTRAERFGEHIRVHSETDRLVSQTFYHFWLATTWIEAFFHSGSRRPWSKHDRKSALYNLGRGICPTWLPLSFQNCFSVFAVGWGMVKGEWGMQAGCWCLVVCASRGGRTDGREGCVSESGVLGLSFI